LGFAFIAARERKEYRDYFFCALCVLLRLNHSAQDAAVLVLVY
jgi:hypothetical protein